MEDLTKCTFIIPLKIDHLDRLRNLKSTIGYLNYNFKTNVIIYEIEDDLSEKIKKENPHLYDLSDLTNLNLNHIVKSIGENNFFHRTRYLNEMLEMVDTPVVCNYDIDIILPKNSYLHCINEILSGNVDVYYPFSFGASQYQILQSASREEFELKWDCSSLIKNHLDFNIYLSEYGHCIFFNTSIYRELGGENEYFRSYGPEDKERGMRFIKCGKKVEWMDGFVFHFEHHRGNDSSYKNPHLSFNNSLFQTLSSFSKEEIENYYSRAGYRKKYPRMKLIQGNAQ